MTHLMNIVLLNKNEISLEMIHLSDNHCCRYVDPTFFTVFSEMQL